jgi:hypothetical protein
MDTSPRRLNPRTRAVVLSALVWPGAGQMYNGERVKGLCLIGASGLLAVALAVTLGLFVANGMVTGFDPETVRIVVPRALGLGGVLVLVWAAAVVDAWRGAR